MSRFVHLLMVLAMSSRPVTVLAQAPDYPILVDGVGSIMGSLLQSEPSSKNYTAFYAIPYGKPTSGAARFGHPEPADPLEKTLDATIGTYVPVAFTKRCVQPNYVGVATNTPPFSLGSEDCLNLAVFTPSGVDGRTDRKNLPVMVYFHGGTFINAGYDAFGPTRFMEHDVVVVQVHYRLGPLGWLCSGTGANNGLRDARLALRWVQDHIADFGGDPGSVTIFGSSAGSAIVTYLMMMESAKGLFHRAIGQSGTALNGWAFDANPQEAIAIFEQMLQCPSGQIVACLSGLDQDTLSAAHVALQYELLRRGMINARGVASPCQEDWRDPEAVVPFNPQRLMFRRRRKRLEVVNSVPMLLGVTRDEGIYTLGTIIGTFLEPNGLQNNSTYLRDEMLNDMLVSLQDPRANNRRVLKGIRKKWFPNDELGNLEAMKDGLVRYATSAYFKEPVLGFAQANSRQNPTFLYSFDFDKSAKTLYPIFTEAQPPPAVPAGVSHSDDMMYQWSFPSFPVETDVEKAAATTYVSTMVYFAENGFLGSDDAGIFIPPFPRCRRQRLQVSYLKLEDQKTTEHLLPPDFYLR